MVSDVLATFRIGPSLVTFITTKTEQTSGYTDHSNTRCPRRTFQATATEGQNTLYYYLTILLEFLTFMNICELTVRVKQ